MRVFIPIILLILSVTALCIWDGIYTNKAFDGLYNQTQEIKTAIENEEFDFEKLNNKTEELNAYWIRKMNVLCISISRKDLQPVSDYLQYLAASIKNESKEDCLTYIKLLDYNIQGLSEAYGVSLANLL